jgi:hypothetical protein
MRVGVWEGKRDGSSVAEDETTILESAERWADVGVGSFYCNVPSISMSTACPDDLEHRAPEVSMKKTWLLLSGLLMPGVRIR